jgi:hypothetical protein
MRNTVAMLPTGTGKRRINSGVRVLVAQAALVIARVASGEPVVRAALVELADQVAQEALAELVVQVVEPELSQEEAEQALGPVAAALELSRVEGLGLVQVAVAPRTRSVIAAHHRGLVAVPRVEDSAAAAETTRAPAAVEAVRAWEAVE